MKKVFLTLAVVAFVASLASCKKTCTCVTETNGVEEMVVEMEAIGGCAEMNTSMTIGDMTTTTTCE